MGINIRDMSVLRLFRILRVSRGGALVLRIVRTIPEMVTIVKGLNEALRPMIFTSGLIMLFTWVSSILLMQLTEKRVIGGVGWTSLLQCHIQLLGAFAFFEGATDALQPMTDDSKYWLAALACGFFLFIVGFVFVNVYAGMLVNCISAVSEKEGRESAAVGLFHGLRNVFEEVDPKMTGEVNLKLFDEMAKQDDFHEALSEIGLKKHHLPLLRHAFFTDKARVFESYREFLQHVVHMDPGIPASRMAVADARVNMRAQIKHSTNGWKVHCTRIRQSQAVAERKVDLVISTLGPPPEAT